MLQGAPAAHTASSGRLGEGVRPSYVVRGLSVLALVDGAGPDGRDRPPQRSTGDLRLVGVGCRAVGADVDVVRLRLGHLLGRELEQPPGDAELDRARESQNSVAKIGTYLDQVVDVFYVTDQAGNKIEDEARLQHIRTRLLEASAGVE